MECSKCLENDPTKFYTNCKNTCKKCYSNRANTRYHDLNNLNKSVYMYQQKQWRSSNIFRVRHLAAKHRAKRKGIECTITIDNLEELYTKQNGKCFYSGLAMTKVEDRKYVLSIDRIDSAKGYIPSNVVLVCSIVNSMKNDLNFSEFSTIVNVLSANMADIKFC